MTHNYWIFYIANKLKIKHYIDFQMNYYLNGIHNNTDEGDLFLQFSFFSEMFKLEKSCNKITQLQLLYYICLCAFQWVAKSLKTLLAGPLLEISS